MKSIKFLFILIICSLTFYISCDNSGGIGGGDQENGLPDYYFIINYLGTEYTLAKGSLVETDAYVKTTGTFYNIFASKEDIYEEDFVGESGRGLKASFPNNQISFDFDNSQNAYWMYFSVTTGSGKDHGNALSMDVTITNSTSSVLEGTYTGTMDNCGAGSNNISGSFKLKKI